MEMKIDNFTAILPVTCNADCTFCPEKEMPNDLKANKDDYVYQLVEAVNKTVHLGYDHVSISGGEPSLDPRLLKRVVRAIINETPIKKVGLTTNGRFLESDDKINSFVDAIISDDANVMLDFINISRHAVRTEDNNKIMGVSYTHTLRDLISFRNLLPETLSFHINVVVEQDRDLDLMFKEFEAVANTLLANNISIVFRTAYDWLEQVEDPIPAVLVEKFKEKFGNTITISECDTCLTTRSISYPNVYLKGATFEPTEHEEIARELIMHQDGKLYFDWGREKEYIEPEKAAELYLADLLGEPTVLTKVARMMPAAKPVSLSEMHASAYRNGGVIQIVEVESENCAFYDRVADRLLLEQKIAAATEYTAAPAIGPSCDYREPVEYRGCDFGRTSCGFGGGGSCGY